MSFTFDRPRTFHPGTHFPQLVAGVNVSNGMIVAAYNSFGFPNNDPKVIGGRADALIEKSIAIYSRTFSEQVVANLARAGNLHPSSSVLGALYAQLAGTAG